MYEKDRNDVVGLILAKDLLFIDPEDELPMRSFMSLFCRPIQSVWPDDRLTEVIQFVFLTCCPVSYHIHDFNRCLNYSSNRMGIWPLFEM